MPRRTIVWSVLLFAGPFAAAVSAQSHDDVAKKLAGMWRLVANPQRMADGTTKAGSNTVGYAFFDAAAGHMCFLSMNPDRPKWKSGRPTPEEAVSAIGGIGAYCATLEIHPQEGFMIRHYDINQNPNAVGRTTKRWYTFDGPDKMTLRVDSSELTPPVVETLYVWERVVSGH
ncbi:MAG TPA: lipocalin-like domain-containing protein [Bryobacteraceae bacterium]|jgi:hypothetical protein|nr:lipocalin-like domain-containing protein [Bryobacteraceae bacterium]